MNTPQKRQVITNDPYWPGLDPFSIPRAHDDVIGFWYAPEFAPKDGTAFLAWCKVEPGPGDGDATPDYDPRVVWWETRGQFTSDRDLGPEKFDCWQFIIPPRSMR
jgi:hypothetical protein